VRDEIAGGGSGSPRPRTAAAVVIVAALLVGYVVTHRHPASRPAAAPSPGATPTAAPVPRAAPRLSAEGGPDLLGRVGAGPAGVRLLVGGTDPRIVDAHTLSVTPVPGLRLPPGLPAQVLQYGSDTVALAPLYGPDGGIYLVRPGARPLLLGGYGVYVPSRDRGLVVATYRRGATTVTGLGLDRRVRWQWTQPGNVDPLRDTPAGLVAARYANPLAGDAVLLLLDRRTGAVRRRLGTARYPLATDDRSVAWVPDRCAPACPVVRTDLVTGAARRYRMPARRQPAVGAFSPDGRRLALTFAGVPAGPGAAAGGRGFAGVLDLRTGALATVPGLATPTADHADVTWSADGRWLVIGVKWPEEELIALWRPGSEVTILPLALPGEPTNATVSALR
jgi:hypothetical protein